MRRAEFWTVSGGGQYTGKPRPAVIVQDDHFDTDSVALCPFTTDPTDAPLFRLLIEPDARSPAPWPVVKAAEALRLSTIGPPDLGLQPDPDTWPASLGALPQLAQPGKRWLYGTGTSVLRVLAARAAGQPFGEVLRSRVFAPLGMGDTAFFTTATDQLATAYPSTPDGLVVWDQPDGIWSRPPAFGDGTAGLVSTVDDLLAFARMLLRGGAPVLAADAVCANDDRPADAGQEGIRQSRPGLLRRPVVGVLPGGARQWCLRLGRRLRLVVAGRPEPRPSSHRADPARVRFAGSAEGPPRHSGGRVRGARLSGLSNLSGLRS